MGAESSGLCSRRVATRRSGNGARIEGLTRSPAIAAVKIFQANRMLVQGPVLVRAARPWREVGCAHAGRRYAMLRAVNDSLDGMQSALTRRF